MGKDDIVKSIEAVAYVGSLTFHPGWKLEAEPYDHRFEDSIKVNVVLTEARRSEREYFPKFYVRVPGGAKAAWIVSVGDISDPIDLLYRLTEQVAVDNFRHEWREFLREAVTGRAPLHPHTTDGMATWSRCHGSPIAHDLSFGLA